MRFICLHIIFFIFCGCLGLPQNIIPVEQFDVSRYTGKWYEIARLDHSFERGLDNVTAEYVLQDDGKISVLNRGFSKKHNKWEKVTGKARFVGIRNTGYLKVSFFGPFYGSYVIFELGKNYQYAYVTSSKKSYLWLLARSPEAGKKEISRFVKKCRYLGFDTGNLIFVSHDKEILKNDE